MFGVLILSPQNEFRGQPSITMDVFVQMLTTYLSEQNMIDLMHLATDAHSNVWRCQALPLTVSITCVRLVIRSQLTLRRPLH